MGKRTREFFEEELREWVKDQTQTYDASHDVVHAQNVARLSKEIIRHDLPNVQKYMKDAIVALALTHDVCDRKYNTNKTEATTRVVDMCREIGMSKKSVNIVRNVICHISFSKRLVHGVPTNLNSDEMIVYYVVSDADMLEAMGITGMIRTFMYQAVTNQQTESALAHTTGTLFKCGGHLVHEWAKKEGNLRHRVMVDACNQLCRERQPL
jgi:HD superfamily phosphodiesterase